MGRSERTLRFQVMNLKKELLQLKTTFVVQKTRMKQKIVNLKQQNNKLKNDLKLFIGNDDYFSDEDGIIDMSKNDDDSPKTPEQSKQEIVSTPSVKGKK